MSRSGAGPSHGHHDSDGDSNYSGDHGIRVATKILRRFWGRVL